jgi:very-short-patch-repair endonuclease
MDRLRFLEKARNLHGYKYEYIDLSDKLKVSDIIKVKFDEVVYYQKVLKHLNGRCPEKVSYKKTTEEFILESKEVWGDKYDYSLTKYEGALNNIKVIFNGIVYEQRAKSHLEGSAPEFRKNDESRLNDLLLKSDEKGEKEIEEFLKKFKINFNRNYILEGIKFDFYIQSIRTCIEFDGLYHFQSVESLGGIKTLNKTKINDKIKNDYCEDNYIELVRIKYDRIDDVYQILWEALKNKIKKTN